MPRLCSSLVLSLLIVSSASAVTMDWTPIGNPGNPTDPDSNSMFCGPNSNQRCGSVAYTYNIGTYEVTNGQYAEFLNAKAASDPLGLYNINMGDPSFGNSGGITRTGSSGSYSYSAIAGRENMPVNYVSFYDAARFANWMNNGQGSGATETGAYTLLGGSATPSNGTTVTRNPGASIFLTSENEWYKAAYYDASSGNYFAYPAGSNTQTVCASPSAATNTANCNGVINPPSGYPTPVGSYSGSPSPYGTFDQGGNVFEWNETASADTTYREYRGGSFYQGPGFLSAPGRGYNFPTGQSFDTGFRLATMIPEPGTGLLVIGGLIGLAGWRRARD
jgi:formylglycine-generating enzyme required for sulfatase activity